MTSPVAREFRPHEVTSVLAHWRLKPMFTRPAGGTANASLVIVGVRGQYVLRRRNPRYAAPGQLAYDHAVLQALGKAGLPVPKVVRGAGGTRWVEHEGRVYELFQFIEGSAHNPEDLNEVAAAGAMLARFHRATEQLAPQGQKDWPRYFDPKVSIKTLKEAKKQFRGAIPGDLSPHTPQEVDNTLSLLLQAAQDCERNLPDKAYWALPQVIVHGDWHPANLVFNNGQVAGIFDFDWVGRQPRMVDVADGLLFFGSLREAQMDGGDIWSLTQPYVPVPERMRMFLEAYQGHMPLERRELDALPNFLRQRALYMRLDAMARKVPEERGLAFLVAGRVPEALEWIAAHEAELRRGF